MKLIVYTVKDIARAKKLYSTFLGTAPYADAPYYVGFHVSDVEVGLAGGPPSPPIGYVDVTDLRASLAALVEAGGTVKQEPKDVGGGIRVATVTDADGNILGLRQKP